MHPKPATRPSVRTYVPTTDGQHAVRIGFVRPKPGNSASVNGPQPVTWRDHYASLRRLARAYMRGERIDHTLNPTALVHEAFLRITRSDARDKIGSQDFVRLMARTMRLVLIDSARRRNASKRRGASVRVPLEAELVAFEPDLARVLMVDQALTKLETVDAELASIVELRYFAGLNEHETATALGCSARTIRRQWAIARMWLARELMDEAS